MNIWEAKYKALAAGIKDKTLIDNAEKFDEKKKTIGGPMPAPKKRKDP